MTNKKLWLSLLAVVLIVCMLSVCLVSCKKDDDTPADNGKKKPTKSIELQAIEAIVAGVKASVEDGDMTDLTVDGSIGLKVNDTQYSLDLALDLDLRQYTGWTDYTLATEYKKGANYYTKNTDGTYSDVDVKASEFEANKYYTRSKTGEETSTDSNTFLNAELKKGNDTLLGVYYYDYAGYGSKTKAADPYEGDYLYLQYKPKTGDQQKLKFPAPYVNATMKALNASVNFSGIDLGDEGVWGSLDTYLGIVAGLAEGGELTSTKASVTLNIGTLLDPNNENNLLSLVGGIQSYFDALELDIDAEELGDILPNITLTLSADLDNGKATGFDISLGLAKKDIIIKNTETKSEIIDIKMSKNVDITLSLDYEVGGTPSEFMPEDYASYKKLNNLIDIQLSADVAIKEDISMTFKLNDNDMALTVPGGQYTLSIYAALDPFCILDDINDISFDTTGDIINSITTLLEAVNALELKLQKTAEYGETTTLDPLPDPAVYILVGTSYTASSPKNLLDTETVTIGTREVTRAKKYVRVSTTILSKGGSSISLAKGDIAAAIDLVKGFIPTTNKADDAHKNEAAPSTADDVTASKRLRASSTISFATAEDFSAKSSVCCEK